ncbi:MAG: tRNA-dihydrouridine synthase C [Bacteroidia bacterium]|jgi:tRNA-dihydrouridine synthase C
MKLILAPMEGVVNARMRALLTAVGGIDRCVTEFVRVTTQLLPPRVFYRYCPELQTNSCTPSGTPVYLQLLGSEPQVLAENAARAAELGAAGIDLNFGCPAKTVNKHRGGSILLDEPELIHRIVCAVRRAVPLGIPLSVKIRLGYEHSDYLMDVARAIAQGGANELVVHARTKAQGYKPPAHWQRIAELKTQLAIPVIANGEVWTPSDYARCRTLSLCNDVMLGRGLLANPGLAAQLKFGAQPVAWPAVLELLRGFHFSLLHTCSPKHACGPAKQWLGYLKLHYSQAAVLLARVKRITQAELLLDILDSELASLSRMNPNQTKKDLTKAG